MVNITTPPNTTTNPSLKTNMPTHQATIDIQHPHELEPTPLADMSPALPAPNHYRLEEVHSHASEGDDGGEVPVLQTNTVHAKPLSGCVLM